MQFDCSDSYIFSFSGEYQEEIKYVLQCYTQLVELRIDYRSLEKVNARLHRLHEVTGAAMSFESWLEQGTTA